MGKFFVLVLFLFGVLQEEFELLGQFMYLDIFGGNDGQFLVFNGFYFICCELSVGVYLVILGVFLFDQFMDLVVFLDDLLVEVEFLLLQELEPVL